MCGISGQTIQVQIQVSSYIPPSPRETMLQVHVTHVLNNVSVPDSPLYNLTREQDET